MPVSTVKGRGEKPKAKMPSLKQAKNKRWEDLLEFQLKQYGLGHLFEREYIVPELQRGFRWDFADKANKVLIEFQGSIFSPGKTAHNSGVGIMRDHEKTNLANYHGFTVFQFSDRTIRDLSAIDMLVRFYKEKVFI